MIAPLRDLMAFEVATHLHADASAAMDVVERQGVSRTHHPGTDVLRLKQLHFTRVCVITRTKEFG